LALRAGSVGLVSEASLVAARAGWGREAELGTSSRPPWGWRQLCVSRLLGGRSLRPASNGQLRTGTDRGNPTVLL